MLLREVAQTEHQSCLLLTSREKPATLQGLAGSGKQLQTLRQDRPYERLTIAGVRGLTQAQLASLRTLGAVEDDASPGFDRHVRWEAKTA